jgi:hypothetical protein
MHRCAGLFLARGMHIKANTPLWLTTSPRGEEI